MIQGRINDQDVPVIELEIAHQRWPAIIDTGFNGDLELPNVLQERLAARFIARDRTFLAGGQSIMEDIYRTTVSFDGEQVKVDVTFVQGDMVLVGMHLLRRHRLEINSPRRTVVLERVF